MHLTEDTKDSGEDISIKTWKRWSGVPMPISVKYTRSWVKFFWSGFFALVVRLIKTYVGAKLGNYREIIAKSGSMIL